MMRGRMMRRSIMLRALCAIGALSALAAGLVGCGRSGTRSYYTLTYPIADGRFAESFDVTIRIKEVDLRESYRRSEIVLRPDRHELRYDRARRWSERPQKMITSLLVDHLRASNLVRQVDETMGQTPAEYTLSAEVEAIEEVQAGAQALARLSMSLRLVRFADDTVVWTYRFDARRPAGGIERNTTRSTVRALSGILQAQFDLALDDLALYLAEPTAPRLARNVEPVSAQPAPESDGGLRWTPDDPLNELPGLNADTTPMGVGFGAVFVPSLSGTRQEPPVAVYDARTGSVVAEGRPGARVVLPPGPYDVRFGTGTVSQQLASRIEVSDGRTVVVPPRWATLQVDVLDEQFVPFRGTYELIRMDNREDYGIGFGADEQLGEKLRVWALPPGLYKIIRSGGTYRDRTDFATVRLVAGEHSRFTLVLDDDTGEFLGAGEVDPAQTANRDKTWTVRGVVGGSVVFNDTEQAEQQQGRSYGASVFFDGALTYRKGAHLWHSRLELEEEQTQAPEDDFFTNDADRLFLHTIYTYVVVPWFGPYARVGAETSLLTRYQAISNPGYVCSPGPDGQVTGACSTVDGPDGPIVEVDRDEAELVDRLRLGGSFAPLQLREGTGGNFRVLRKRSIELDLRLGLGARQTLANGLRTYSDRISRDDPSPDDPERALAYYTYSLVDDTYVTGVEGTIVGFARPLPWVTVSTEFDGLLAFDQENSSFTWRNQISLRLASFASLNYRYNLTLDPAIIDETQTEHDVQLRFSYTLF